MTCQVVPASTSPSSSELCWTGVVAPVLAGERLLLLEQRDGRIELGLVQRVRVGDAQVGLGGHQVQRRVGDVDGAVVDRDRAVGRAAAART